MGSSSTSWTSESNTHAGSSKVHSSSTWDAYVSTNGLKIQGAEGNAGILELFADEGDDNADKWKWQVADGGAMTWESYTGGSYAPKLTLSTDGLLTVAGVFADITIGTDADGTDRSVVFGHSTLKTIMGIDDSLDCFVINTDAAFDSTLENNSLSIDASHNVEIAGNFSIQAAKKLYFDGGAGSGATYIHEASADTLHIVVGGTTFVEISEGGGGANDYFAIQAANKLYLDGGSNTYLQESSACILDIYVGGANMMKFTETTTDKIDILGEIYVGVNDAGHDVKFYGNADGQYMLWDTSRDDLILSSGSLLGIGTASPSYGLDIQSAGAQTMRVLSTDDDATVRITAGGLDDNSILYFQCNDDLSEGRIYVNHDGTPADQKMIFDVGDSDDVTTAMVIRGDGKIGMGTGTPLSTLDVRGRTRFGGPHLLARTNVSIASGVLNITSSQGPFIAATAEQGAGSDDADTIVTITIDDAEPADGTMIYLTRAANDVITLTLGGDAASKIVGYFCHIAGNATVAGTNAVIGNSYEFVQLIYTNSNVWSIMNPGACRFNV